MSILKLMCIALNYVERLKDTQIPTVYSFKNWRSQIEIANIEPVTSCDWLLIPVDSELYHIGATLKELGKKWFAFSQLEMSTGEMLSRLDG